MSRPAVLAAAKRVVASKSPALPGEQGGVHGPELPLGQGGHGGLRGVHGGGLLVENEGDIDELHLAWEARQGCMHLGYGVAAVGCSESRQIRLG